MDNDQMLNKLYLNPVKENITHRKILKPIQSKRNSRSLTKSSSVPDLFSCLNGGMIIQKWNTKANIPKDIEACINLPVIVDRAKIKKLIKSKNLIQLKDKKKINKLNNFRIKKNFNGEKTSSNYKIYEKNLMGEILNRSTHSKLTKRSFAANSLNATGVNSLYSNSIAKVDKKEEENEEKKKEKEKSECNSNSNNNNTPIVQSKQIDNKENAIVMLSHSASMPKLRSQITFDNKVYLKIPIDFSTFDKHLYLRDSDYLYAKRIGGPVDFALCTYEDIKIENNRKFRGPRLSLKQVQQYKEYLTISKNIVLHYKNNIPQIYSVTEWADNYIKYKKLMNIPLFKNFKIAKLFELWQRFFKKSKRSYYTQKLKRKFHLIDKSLLKGILNIRKILKSMSNINLFRLDIQLPVHLNKFTKIYMDNLNENNRKVNDYRERVKHELSQACEYSYKEFKRIKKITLDDLIEASSNNNKNKNNDNDNDKKKYRYKMNKYNENNIQTFIKENVPYAQDATRKTHFKKLLRFIRLIDFLFCEAKFNLILNSMSILNKRFQRLYEAYIEKWNDPPILIVSILTKDNSILYNPSIENIKNAIFNHVIQENIYIVINTKNFLDPQEFPIYMISFEEVFEMLIDQNANLNHRIKECSDYITLHEMINQNFNKCYKELDNFGQSLTSVLVNYTTYTNIDFDKLEEQATPEQLKDLLEKFRAEERRIRKLERKVNIGIFEFHLNTLLDKVVDSPRRLLNKLYFTIPDILASKLKRLIDKIGKYHIEIQNTPTNVKSFIQLKNSLEEIGKIKPIIKQEDEEISELITIANANKQILIADFDLRLISELGRARGKFERRYDSMLYFIEYNIKRFRSELKTTIQNFDNKIKSLIDEINDSIINEYNDNTEAPLMALNNKSIQISKAQESKKIFQQQEIDIEMDDTNKSNFENLEMLTYEYNLKLQLWNNVKEFQNKTRDWENTQVMNIQIKTMEEYVSKWMHFCKIAIVDLEKSNVAIEMKKKIEVYQKIISVISTIQNANVQNVSNLREMLKMILEIKFDFNDPNLTLLKLLRLPRLMENFEEIKNLNIRANEEQRIKKIYKTILNSFNSHRLPLKIKNDGKRSYRYVIYSNDFDMEYEYIEKNVALLNREMMNEYVVVIKNEISKLIESFYKYQSFLDLFNIYQTYTLKVERVILNTKFAKEMPLEYKKISNESLTKTLRKILKDSISLGKYIEHGHDKTMQTLNNIIASYEVNYKGIIVYLDKKRKEYPPFFMLSNDDMIEMFEAKDSIESRRKLLLKLFSWIIDIDPGRDNDDMIKILTDSGEKINIKYIKTTRTLRDAIETIEQGMFRKLKDTIRQFKIEYDMSLVPKAKKHPKDIIKDLLKNEDNLAQAIFNCELFYINDTIEKALSIEDEAFDKLFDSYHECKDERRVGFIKMLKDKTISNTTRRIILSLISLQIAIITNIETLIREDVSNVNDYTYQRMLIIKINDDILHIKLLNYSIEYGYEYVGIQNDFYYLPQTERVFLSIFNVLSLHKPFMLYSPAHIPKKETLSMFSNIIGKYVIYWTVSKDFNVSIANNLIYAYMRNGGWVCFDHCEYAKLQLLGAVAERVSEVYLQLKVGEEENAFNEGNDKFGVVKGEFNVFFNYEIKDVLKRSELPMTIRERYRLIGFSVIDVENYLRIILNNYVFCNTDLIVEKIMCFLDVVKCKFDEDLRDQRGNMKYWVISILKTYIVDNLHCIRNYNECAFVMKGLEKIIAPMIPDENKKEELRKVMMLIFNNDNNNNVDDEIKGDNENVNDNDKEKEEEQQHEQEKEKEEKEKENLDQIDLCLKDELNKFSFKNNIYQTKIKELYESMRNNSSFVLIGPSLTGKSNVFVTLNSISIKLNEINKEKYPLFEYVKIFPKSFDPKEIFISNNLEVYHHINNIYFYNINNILEFEERMLRELNEHYKLMNSAQGSVNTDIVITSEQTIELAEKYTTIGAMNRANQNEEEEEEEFEIKEEDKAESDIDNDNNNLKKTKTKFTKTQIDSPIKEDTSYKAFIFDGEIDPLWYEYLTFLYGTNNNMIFSNGDCVSMYKRKFLYETSSLSNASPSFITKQYILSLNEQCFSWENILYTYIETNLKLKANLDLKNYVRGLFENYIAIIIDFIHLNKIKCINKSINDNFIITNLIKLFDSILPLFDFIDNKIGRKSLKTESKIESIKKQTLSIFIFSCAWTINFNTNFLIKTKIEKFIGDIFKTDDLKGPIFDYFINSNNDFELWVKTLTKEQIQLPEMKKNEIFDYDKIYLTTVDNLPYKYIIEKLIDNGVSFFLLGKPCIGKSFLLRTIIDDVDNQKTKINPLKISMTHRTKSSTLEKFIISHQNVVKRNIYSDKYNRRFVVFVDDVHVAYKDQYGTVEFQEYMRMLLCTMTTYDSKINIFKYFKKMSIINCGNFYSYKSNESFDRYIGRFNLVTFNINEETFINVFKNTLEFHLRNYIPNTSSITASQYISTLFKMKELFNLKIPSSPYKLHYVFNMRDITQIIQSFHLFLFKGSSEYPEYLRKIYFYESYLRLSNKIHNHHDIEVCKDIICQAFSLNFRQNKVTKKQIFNHFNSEDTYIYAKDFINADYHLPSSIHKAEHVYYEKKIILVEYIANRIKEFYSSIGKKEECKIFKWNKELIDSIIRILRVLENGKDNLILLGSNHCGKDLCFKIALFIYCYDIIEVNMLQFKNSYNDFIKKTILKALNDVVYEHKKIFILFSYQIFSNSNKQLIDFILETICNLLNGERAIKTYNDFLNERTYGKIDSTTLIHSIEENLSICISIKPKSYAYNQIFTYYPLITSNSSTIYFHKFKDANLLNLSNNILFQCLNLNKEENNIKQIESYSNFLIDVHNFSCDLCDEYSKKININIKINQRHYIKLCNFIIDNYNKFKSILTDKLNDINYAKNVVTKCEIVLNKLKSERDKIQSNKENNMKQIEQHKTKINQITNEKNLIKIKRQEQGKPMQQIENERNERIKNMKKILHPYKDLIRKHASAMHKINEKDIVEIKNTYDNSPPGKFVLSKIFEVLRDKNGSDWDYIKKSLELKTLKQFINIDISKAPQNFNDISKEVISHPDYGGTEKYQKPYKAVGLIFDYFNSCSKYFDEYNNQKEDIDKIEVLRKKMEELKGEIDKYNEKFLEIEKESSELEKNISQYEMNNDNYSINVIKYEQMINEINVFIDLSKKMTSVWIRKADVIQQLIKYFDVYMLYISLYITYAIVLSKSYRDRFTKYVYNSIENHIDNRTNIKQLDFYTIASNFFDLTGKDKDFAIAIDSFSPFVKENIFIMEKFSDGKVPYIIDYNQEAITILSKFEQFHELKTINVISFNDPINEIKEKIINSIKSGTILFIRDSNDIVYNYFYNYIKNNITIESYRKYVKIGINDTNTEIKSTFKLYILKNTYDTIINEDAFYDTLIINFTSNKKEVKKYLFESLSDSRDKDNYFLYRKEARELVKEKYKLLELQSKINKTILLYDLNANVDKLATMQSLNDRYKGEYQSYISSENNMQNIKKYVDKYKAPLVEKFHILSDHGSKILKWIGRFFLLNSNYIITSDYFNEILVQFIQKKSTMSSDSCASKKQNNNIYNNITNDLNINREEEGNDTYRSNNKNINTIDYIYAKGDIKELVLFIYNKISHIYSLMHRNTLLLILLFIALDEKEKPHNFKNLLYITYEVINDKDIEMEKEQSPVKTITNEQWATLKSINMRCNFELSPLLEDIESNPTIYNEYLSEDKNVIAQAKYYYIYNLFKLPTKEIDSQVDELIKFVFFYVIKPFQSEMMLKCLTDQMITDKFTICKNDHSLIRNFNKCSNKAITLVMPNETIENPIKAFDKEIKEYCYNSLLANYPNVKCKEFIAKGELSISEQEVILQFMKSGGIIIIKNAHLIQSSLNKIYDKFNNENDAIISPAFKLILIVKNNTIINKNLLSHSIFSNTNSLHCNRSTKFYVIEALKTISNKIFNDLLNITNSYRKIARKFIITYIIIFSVLRTNEFHIPINYSIKDFHLALGLIEHVLLSLQDDISAQFLSIENSIGLNYNSFTSLVNDVFFINRLIYNEDITLMQSILKKFFDPNTFMQRDCYFFSPSVQIPIIDINETLSYESLYNLLNKYSEEDYNELVHSLTLEAKREIQVYNINQLLYIFKQTIKGVNVKQKEKYKGNVMNALNSLNNIKKNLPKVIKYNNEEAQQISDEKIEISQMLFKKNKIGHYVNPLDESLLYEIQYYNNYIAKISGEIECLYNMIKGNKNYLYNSEFDHFNYYYTSIIALSRKEIPKLFIDGKIFKEKIKYSINKFLTILIDRIKAIKKWIKDGTLLIYNTALLTKPRLFYSCLKTYFCRKGLTELNLSLTPDMIRLKYFFTKCKTIEDFTEENKRSIMLLQPNEVIFINGLVINNAIIDIEKMSIEINSKYKRVKCNIAGITYTVNQYTSNDNNLISLSSNKGNNDKEGEEEEDEDEEKSARVSQIQFKRKMTMGKRDEDESEKILKIPLTDNENEDKCFYGIIEPIGVFEFRLWRTEDTLSAIENNVRIYMDDYEE